MFTGRADVPRSLEVFTCRHCRVQRPCSRAPVHTTREHGPSTRVLWTQL